MGGSGGELVFIVYLLFVFGIVLGVKEIGNKIDIVFVFVDFGWGVDVERVIRSIGLLGGRSMGI